jgi:gas vesicle protein
MAQAEEDVKHLLDECRTIEENCLYTAQAHYVIANQENWKKWILLVVPAFLSGLAGALVATGLPTWIGIIGAALGGLGGVAAALGVDRESGNHTNAGKIMTSMRHEARQFHEVFWKELSRTELRSDVRRLADRYNNLRLILPATTDKAFEKARKRIREGIFVPDFKTSTAIPPAQET